MPSLSLGPINLMQIPMLDGGHLMFYAFEAARRRPLGKHVQKLGFAPAWLACWRWRCS
jgi:regulator of sigma E protease